MIEIGPGPTGLATIPGLKKSFRFLYDLHGVGSHRRTSATGSRQHDCRCRCCQMPPGFNVQIRFSFRFEVLNRDRRCARQISGSITSADPGGITTASTVVNVGDKCCANTYRDRLQVYADSDH